MNNIFDLETPTGSKECRIITSLYSETRDKHYLVYEYVDGSDDALFVSSYNPASEECELDDIKDEQELKEIEELLEDEMED